MSSRVALSASQAVKVVRIVTRHQEYQRRDQPVHFPTQMPVGSGCEHQEIRNVR